MEFSISERHFHEYRPITPDRAQKLDEMLLDVRKSLPTSTYAIGGGNAIPLLIRVYQEIIAKKTDVTKAKEEVWQWLPKDATKTMINGIYRDSNFVPHIICTEGDLEYLVDEAKKSGLALMRRTRGIVVPGTSKKIETYDQTTPDEVKERSFIGSKEKYKSNSLRLVDLKAKQLTYFDLFVHHYVDELGNKVTKQNNVLKNISGKEISSKEVRIMSNKDQTGVADESILMPFESFTMIPYKFNDEIIMVANPKYISRVKTNHFKKLAKKAKTDTRDVIDIEIISNMLNFLQVDNPINQMYDAEGHAQN